MCRRTRTRRKRGGGIRASKPKNTPLRPRPETPTPGKMFVFFDMDGTLLYRNDILGQMTLHERRMRNDPSIKKEDWRAKESDVVPPPDKFWEPSSTFYYLRPGVKEALEYANACADGVYAFSASSTAKGTLEFVGLSHYFKHVFGLEATQLRSDKKGNQVFHKLLESVRSHLGMAPTDKLIMIDDHPEWIIPSGPNDILVPIQSFMPNYKLYGFQFMKHSPSEPDPTDMLPDETTLIDVVRSIFERN